MVLSRVAFRLRLWYNSVASFTSPQSTEAALNRPFRHLPFALVLFISLFTGLTDLAIGVEPRVLVTLLAPLLWLGLYSLGRDWVAPEA